jgi:hypothetical protein
MRFVASLKPALYRSLYSTLVRFDWSLRSLACFDEQRVRFIDCDALMLVLVSEDSIVDIVTGDMLVVRVTSITMLASFSFLLFSCQGLLI